MGEKTPEDNSNLNEARRKLLKLTAYSTPLIVGKLMTSQMAFAQSSCTPFACGPAGGCTPDTPCEPDACDPALGCTPDGACVPEGSCTPTGACGPTGFCGPDGTCTPDGGCKPISCNPINCMPAGGCMPVNCMPVNP